MSRLKTNYFNTRKRISAKEYGDMYGHGIVENDVFCYRGGAYVEILDPSTFMVTIDRSDFILDTLEEAEDLIWKDELTREFVIHSECRYLINSVHQGNNNLELKDLKDSCLTIEQISTKRELIEELNRLNY